MYRNDNYEFPIDENSNDDNPKNYRYYSTKKSLKLVCMSVLPIMDKHVKERCIKTKTITSFLKETLFFRIYMTLEILDSALIASVNGYFKI